MAEMAAWDGPAVIKMIEERRFDEAGARVSEMLEGHPWHLPASLARARLFLALGKTGEALELTDRLARQQPANKWIAALKIDALIASGRLADAQELFLGLLPPQPADEALSATMVDTLVAGDPDAKSRIAFLEKALAAWPGSQLLLLKLATQNFLASRVPEAISSFKAAEALGPLPEYAKLVKDGLVAALGDNDRAIGYLSERVEENPDNINAQRHLIRSLAAAGRFDAAGDRLVKAVERWPGDWRIAFRANHTFVDTLRDEAIFKILSSAATSGEVNDLFRFQFVQFALRSGHDALARQSLAELAERPAIRHMAAPMNAALLRAEALSDEPPRVGVDMADDVDVVAVEGAAATLVVFGSLVGGVGHLPFYVIDPLLARLPVNVVYLRDPYGLAYLKGLPSLGADEGTTAAALAALVVDLGAERVVTTGTSIAGYAAARYGLAIGADAAVSFAGPTKLAVGPSALRPVAVAMEQLRNASDGPDDLTATLAEAGERFKLAMVVGGDYQPDFERATAMGTLGNVETVVLDGVGHHFVAHAAISSDRYLPLLQRFLELGSTHEAP